MLGFKEWYQALYRAKSCQFVPTTWFPPFAFYRTPGFGVASRKAAAKATRRPGRKYQPWSSCSSSVRRFPCASRSTRRRAVPSFASGARRLPRRKSNGWSFQGSRAARRHFMSHRASDDETMAPLTETQENAMPVNHSSPTSPAGARTKIFTDKAAA